MTQFTDAELTQAVLDSFEPNAGSARKIPAAGIGEVSA